MVMSTVLLALPQVAEELGVTLSEVIDLVHGERPAGVHPPGAGRLLVRREDLDRLRAEGPIRSGM